MQIKSRSIPSSSRADTDWSTTRCPSATPTVSTAAGRAVWQCCEGGMWVTYDVNTLKELRREPHTYCEGTGRLRQGGARVASSASVGEDPGMERVTARILGSGTTQPLHGEVVAWLWEERSSEGRLEWGGFFVLPQEWPLLAGGPYVLTTADGRRGEIYIHETAGELVCFRGSGPLGPGR